MNSPIEIKLSFNKKQKDLLCPFCKDTVIQKEVCQCSKCSTLYHQDCFDLNKKCSIFGCNSPIVTRRSKEEVNAIYQKILQESSGSFFAQTLRYLFLLIFFGIFGIAMFQILAKEFTLGIMFWAIISPCIVFFAGRELWLRGRRLSIDSKLQTHVFFLGALLLLIAIFVYTVL